MMCRGIYLWPRPTLTTRLELAMVKTTTTSECRLRGECKSDRFLLTPVRFSPSLHVVDPAEGSHLTNSP
jgi:hypothetical protein